MKKNIKNINLLIAGITALILLPLSWSPSVLAEDEYAHVEEVNIFEALNNIANYAFTLLLIVGVIAIIWAGFMFITAQGDPDKVNKAKKFLVYAIIGIFVAVLARGIVGLIRGVVK